MDSSSDATFPLLETGATWIAVGQRGGILPLGVFPGDVNKLIGSDGLTADKHPGGKFG